MSKTIKNIIVGLAILFGAAALYWLAFRPLLMKVQSTAEQIKIKEADLQRIKVKVANLTDLKEALRNAQAAEEASAQIIPSQLTLADLYSGIDALTKNSGLRVRQITTNQSFQPFNKDRRLKFIAVNLEGNGYFPQVISFLNLLAKSNFLIQVENIDLNSISKGNKPRLHFMITLNAFEYSS